MTKLLKSLWQLLTVFAFEIEDGAFSKPKLRKLN